MARVHHQTTPAARTTERAPHSLNGVGYLTDGRALFHVERTLLDDPHGELLVELEDCATLELIVCSARSVAELGMRPVVPAQAVST